LAHNEFWGFPGSLLFDGVLLSILSNGGEDCLSCSQPSSHEMRDCVRHGSPRISPREIQIWSEIRYDRVRSTVCH